MPESKYSIATVESRNVDGVEFITAETGSLREGGITRQHSRIICADRGSQAFNRPLIYSDDCSSFHGDKLYIYSRHGVNQAQFFTVLDELLEGHRSDSPEIINKPFHCVLNIQGQFTEHDIQLPFSRSIGDRLNQIQFMRLYTAFGDVSIDFSKDPVIRHDELSFINQKHLSKKIEFPICAFDASESEIWVPLLTKVHWASNLVPKNILEILIRDAARVKAWA